jgi:general stress protein 26
MTTHSSNLDNSSTENRVLLWKLIKDIRFAMFTTRQSDGHLHSRPMTTQNKEMDEDDSLWFFMSRASDPVADLAAEPVVNVAYADPGADCYVSVCGLAAVIDDHAKKRQLWTKMAQAWFPGGVDDPDLALVQVRISHANYWNVKASKVSQLLQIAKAAVTGEPPHHMGEQGEISMR